MQFFSYSIWYDGCMQYAMGIWLGGMNAAAFILYGLDKYKAKHSRWRIPEDALIGIAAAGGAAGALLGMYIFHHKTKHRKFQILIPVFILLWAAGLIMIQRMTA